MADCDQGLDDKPRPTGCCGLPVWRPVRTKKGHNRAKPGTDTSRDNKPASGHNHTSAPADPLGLAGITLNLNHITEHTNHSNMTEEMTEHRLEEFKKLFCGGNELHCVDFIRIWGFYDKDHSGYLETKELDKFIKDLIQQKGQKPYPDMIKDVREAILRTADVNKDGRIELAEFSRCLPVEKNFLLQFDSRNSMTRNEFFDVFCHYDPDDNGFIEGHEILALLKDVLTKKGVDIGAHELQDYRTMFIQAYDKDKDGRLSRDELAMLLSVDK